MGIFDNGPAKLVVFGREGDTVHYGRAPGSICGKCTGTGYGKPDRPHAAENLPAGVLCLDLLPAIETDEGFRHAIRGPMVDVDLPDEEVSRCPDPSPIFAAAVAENQFGYLLALNEIHRRTSAAPGPLDHVSITQYVAGWKKLGARIGRTLGNGLIDWEAA